jgi:hypothetical protein
MTNAIRRALAVAVIGLVGVAGAFFVGAHAGSAIDAHTRSVTVARVPFTALEAAVRAQAAQAREHPAPPKQSVAASK